MGRDVAKGGVVKEGMVKGACPTGGMSYDEARTDDDRGGLETRAQGNKRRHGWGVVVIVGDIVLAVEVRRSPPELFCFEEDLVSYTVLLYLVACVTLVSTAIATISTSYG